MFSFLLPPPTATLVLFLVSFNPPTALVFFFSDQIKIRKTVGGRILDNINFLPSHIQVPHCGMILLCFFWFFSFGVFFFFFFCVDQKVWQTYEKFSPISIYSRSYTLSFSFFRFLVDGVKFRSQFFGSFSIFHLISPSPFQKKKKLSLVSRLFRKIQWGSRCTSLYCFKKFISLIFLVFFFSLLAPPHIHTKTFFWLKQPPNHQNISLRVTRTDTCFVLKANLIRFGFVYFCDFFGLFFFFLSFSKDKTTHCGWTPYGLRVQIEILRLRHHLNIEPPKVKKLVN